MKDSEQRQASETFHVDFGVEVHAPKVDTPARHEGYSITQLHHPTVDYDTFGCQNLAAFPNGQKNLPTPPEASSMASCGPKGQHLSVGLASHTGPGQSTLPSSPSPNPLRCTCPMQCVCTSCVFAHEEKLKATLCGLGNVYAGARPSGSSEPNTPGRTLPAGCPSGRTPMLSNYLDLLRLR